MALWIGVEDHDFMIGCDRLLDNPSGIASSSSSSITDRHFATRVAPHGMFPRYQSLLFRSLPLSLPLSFPSSTNHRIHNSDLSLPRSFCSLARAPRFLFLLAAAMVSVAGISGGPLMRKPVTRG